MTSLAEYAHDHLEVADPVQVDIAPAAMNVRLPAPGDQAEHPLPRFVLSISLDHWTGNRLGNADLFLVDGGRVQDHLIPGGDDFLQDLVDRVADIYTERYAIQKQRANR